MPSAQRATSSPERRVWAFLAIAFGISWGAYTARRFGSWDPTVDEALRLIVKIGPSLAGIIVALVYGGATGFVDLVRRLTPPLRYPSWVIGALTLPIGILIVALPLRSVLGGPLQPFARLAIGEGVAVFGTLLATRFFLGGGLGEELGWRGIMLPALQERMTPLNASLLIGLAHGAWHLPAYGPGVLFLTLFTVAGSIVFTWMYNNTEGNLFLPALMHATANASLPFMERIVPAVDGEIAYPLLVFSIWGLVAWLLVPRLRDEAPGSREWNLRARSGRR